MSKLLYHHIYEHCYGPVPEGWHIHHIDGNHKNNHPANLYACSPQEHYNIHYNQKDWYACARLAPLTDITLDELSNLYRLAANKRVEAGTHNWQSGVTQSKTQRRLVEEQKHQFLGGEFQRKIHNERKAAGKSHHFQGGSIQRKSALARLATGTHNFLTQSKIEHMCPNCGKVGKGAAMKRWHFDNCKAKNE